MVDAILTNDTEAERAEALAAALADPDAALTCYRELADKGLATAIADDRRRCLDCANLTPLDQRCGAAARGEKIATAGRRYYPVLDLLRRCEGFTPNASDPDQRSGLERWPYLAADR